MRASFLSWPKASGLPLLVCATAVFNPSLTLGAGDASSVSFVDRDALAANGWNGSAGNPLRAPADASQYRGNPLRNYSAPGGDAGFADNTAQPPDEVVPVSYDEREAGGLQLRPYSPPTGIFSGDNGDSAAANNRPAKPKPRTQNKPTAAQSNQAYQAALPAQANSGNQSAAERAKGFMPQFMSFAPKPKNKTIPASYGPANYGVTGYGSPTYGPAANSEAALAAALAPTARAGSVAQPTPAGGAQSSPYGSISRSQNQLAAGNSAAPKRASYSTAEAAESYSIPGATAGGQNPRRAPQSNAGPTPAYAGAGAANPSVRVAANRQPAVAASYRPTPASPTPAAVSADNSPAAQMLVQVHVLADKASTEDDFSQVYSACQRVMANQPNATEAGFAKQLAAWSLNRRGQIKASAGRSDDALADFSTAIQLDPQLWRAIHNRGVLMAQAGQFDKAFDDFNRTTELNPQFAKAYSNRAALFVVAGQMEPALADYRRACELDPSLEVAQRGCGRTCHMLGHLDEASQHLNRAIELAPNDAASFTSRADLFTDLGNYAQAEADYDRALRLDGKSAEACRGSAWLLATCPDSSIRNPDVAIHRAELAVKMERKPDPTTYDTLAAAQAAAGDFAAATQTLRHAIELAPPSERAVYQDRLSMYRQSTPFQIAPLPGVRQAEYQQN